MLGKFPTSPGLYIAQRGTDVVLFRLNGMYPTLQLGKALSVDQLIESNVIKQASSIVIEHIKLFPEKWNFSPVNQINMSAFPKLSFRSDGNLDLSSDEYISIRSKYYRLIQSGVPRYKIEKAFVYEYKVTVLQIAELLDRFDKESVKIIDLVTSKWNSMLIHSPLTNQLTNISLKEQYNKLNQLYSKPWFGLVECCSFLTNDFVDWRASPEVWKWKTWVVNNIVLKLGVDYSQTTGVKLRIATGMLNKLESLTFAEKIRIHGDLTLTINKEMNAIIEEDLPF